MFHEPKFNKAPKLVHMITTTHTRGWISLALSFYFPLNASKSSQQFIDQFNQTFNKNNIIKLGLLFKNDKLIFFRVLYKIIPLNSGKIVENIK